MRVKSVRVTRGNKSELNYSVTLAPSRKNNFKTKGKVPHKQCNRLTSEVHRKGQVLDYSLLQPNQVPIKANNYQLLLNSLSEIKHIGDAKKQAKKIGLCHFALEFLFVLSTFRLDFSSCSS